MYESMFGWETDTFLDLALNYAFAQELELGQYYLQQWSKMEISSSRPFITILHPPFLTLAFTSSLQI